MEMEEVVYATKPTLEEAEALVKELEIKLDMDRAYGVPVEKRYGIVRTREMHPVPHTTDPWVVLERRPCRRREH